MDYSQTMSWISKLFKKQLKQDGLTHNVANINTSSDKLTYFKPDYYYLSNPKENLGYWESLSLLRKIVNAPAEDSVRNGWKIVTNLVDQDKFISIARYIQNRLDELDIKNILLNAIRYTRIYSKGCLVYYIVDADVPQTENILSQPIPQVINSIQSINLVEESKFHFEYLSESPLSPYYNKPIISIEDVRIHPSRYRWLIKDYNRNLKTGKSILDDVLEFAKTHDLSRWSISNLIFEIATKIFKSPEIGRTLHGEKLNDFLQRLRMALSSQSVLALNTEEEFQKSTYSMSGLKDVLDWITDSIESWEKFPKQD